MKINIVLYRVDLLLENKRKIVKRGDVVMIETYLYLYKRYYVLEMILLSASLQLLEIDIFLRTHIFFHRLTRNTFYEIQRFEYFKYI